MCYLAVYCQTIITLLAKNLYNLKNLTIINHDKYLLNFLIDTWLTLKLNPICSHNT